MDIYSSCIILFGFCILLLEGVRFIVCFPKQEKTPGIDIGKSMTIGNRETQEDQVETAMSPEGVVAVIADGAGQTYGGRIAAKIATQTCIELFLDYNAFHNPQYFFRKAFQTANREILKALGDDRRGTASVGCALIRNDHLYYALVGNVKICVYREGNLVPVSVGHTISVLAEQKFQEGSISREEALILLENRRLYNYLGQDEFRDIEYVDAPVRLRHKDIVVLMSDGIYDLLSVREVEDVLKKAKDCQEKAFEVIELVNRNSGTMKDNASIILMAV